MCWFPFIFELHTFPDTHSLCSIFSSAPHSVSSDNTRARFISRDWQGIRPPVDAAMVGQVYLSPKPIPSSPPARRRSSSRRRKPSKKRGHRRSQNRYIFDDFWTDWSDWFDYADIPPESPTQDYKDTPVQNVYFFKRGNV